MDWAILQVQHVAIPTGFWIIFLRYLFKLISVTSTNAQIAEAFCERESNYYVLYQLVKSGENSTKISRFPDGFQGGASKGSPSFSCLKTLFSQDEDSVDAETALVLQNIIKETTLRSFKRERDAEIYMLDMGRIHFLSLWWSEVTNWNTQQTGFFGARK